MTAIEHYCAMPACHHLYAVNGVHRSSVYDIIWIDSIRNIHFHYAAPIVVAVNAEQLHWSSAVHFVNIV